VNVGIVQAKTPTGINHRYHVAAQVDDAQNVSGEPGTAQSRCKRSTFLNLALTLMP